MTGKITSLDAPRHLYKSPSQAGRGFENAIFINLPNQRGAESGEIYKPNFTPGYCQRVKRPRRRLGAVTADFFREGKFSHVLAIEVS